MGSRYDLSTHPLSGKQNMYVAAGPLFFFAFHPLNQNDDH